MTKAVFLLFSIFTLITCQNNNHVTVKTSVVSKNIGDNSIEISLALKNVSERKIAIQKPLMGFNLHFELITDNDTLFNVFNATPAADSSNYILLENNQQYDETFRINRFGISVEGENEFHIKEGDKYRYTLYYFSDNGYFVDIFNDEKSMYNFYESYGFDSSIVVSEKHAVKGLIE